MRILEYERSGNMLRVTTDHAPMPEFAYPIDTFRTVQELEREILRKIDEVTARKGLRDARRAVVKTELERAGATERINPSEGVR